MLLLSLLVSVSDSSSLSLSNRALRTALHFCDSGETSELLLLPLAGVSSVLSKCHEHRPEKHMQDSTLGPAVTTRFDR